jgi:hypothetical protein
MPDEQVLGDSRASGADSFGELERLAWIGRRR